MAHSSSRSMAQQNNHEHPTPSYVGVRQRKWGKWVSEIREPGKKTRIWLGSYEAPDMAAAAYDVAAFHLKGSRARLNFPELVDSLPKPASSSAEHIQLAAQEAAMLFKRQVQGRPNECGGGGDRSGLGPVRVGLSSSQIQAINESPLDSPKMWMELAGALLGAEPMAFYGQEEFMDDEEIIEYNSIWD